MNSVKQLKEDIESLDSSQQILIGKLLYDSNINMFENKNGVFINLTELDESIIELLKKKIEDIREQESLFIDLELKKQAYKDNLVTKVNEICE
tara:strand:- start:234 stop:512 length:279 start_codon:yes stop_codon:yes gene_type:complete